MKHRFLHTLVFSSVLALEGCASTPPQPLDAVDAEASASGSGAETEQSAPNETYVGSSAYASSAGSSSPSGSSRTASRAPEPSATETSAADMRQCEVGWGTTKSGQGQVDPWDCSVVSVDGVERTECTDASGRCLQP